jgi:2-polyprenyl-6-hydroxyphenyl methylase/3-demethylubiquinone-9 3-methyltransferase
MSDLTSRESHFEFGENWSEFEKLIDERRIARARAGLNKLVPDLRDKTFLDIGSGSGLHALAAIQLGARRVLAVDIDENSVATTQRVLAKHAGSRSWTAAQRSVFELRPEQGTFDVVYSWGVLHHTGDMWKAIDVAASLVAPGGVLAIAIYARTPACRLWKAEKAFYSRAPLAVQWAMRQLYSAAFLAGQTLKRRNPVAYVRNYVELRGMEFSTDMHDWLGGYPYESARYDELAGFLRARGLDEVRAFPFPPSLGIVGTGCHELVFRKTG